jgi:hypothetical protein
MLMLFKAMAPLCRRIKHAFMQVTVGALKAVCDIFRGTTLDFLPFS